MLEAGLGKELDRHLYHMAACMASALAKSNGDKLVGILDLAELSYYKIAHYDSKFNSIYVYEYKNCLMTLIIMEKLCS